MDFKEYGDRLTELGTKYIAEGAQAWETYTRAVVDAFAGKQRGEDLPERLTEIAFNAGPKLARKWTQCNIDYYTGVVNAGVSFTTELLESTFKQGARPERQSGGRKRAARQQG
jgi:hypothetical protein